MAPDAPSRRAAPGAVRLAALALLGVAAAAQEPPAPGLRLEFLGGTPDDRAFAAAAAGRVPGPEALGPALEAVRATDRFSGVEVEAQAGGVARIRLTPWPVLGSWSVRDEGSASGPSARTIFPEVRKGVRAGLARREAWRDRAEQVLRAAGFPSATVAVEATGGGTGLVFTVRRGAPSRITALELEGEAGPYGAAALWKLVGAEPGKTLWTLAFRREALARLRKRFLKDHRYEWRAELQYRGDGSLRLQVQPGPVVELRSEGGALGFGGIEALAPLSRAERYGPELLDEGDRRIFRYLRQQGCLDPSVSHRREVVAGTEARPERVRITYSIRPGPSVVVASLRFEGNEAIGESELREAAGLPTGWFGGWGAPKANPDLLQGLEDRVKAHYLRRGFSEVRVRRAVPAREQGRWVQVLTIREGPRRLVREVRVELPDAAPYDAWAFGEDLLPLLGERPPRRRSEEPADGTVRIFESDRPSAAGTLARLERGPARDGRVAVTLRPATPLPYVKGDLVLAVAAMRARLSALGVQKGRESLDFDETDGFLAIRVGIPDAPRTRIERLVVQGSDRTRAWAILREAELEPGKPLSPEGLGQAQARVANLGAFQRVDLEGLPGQGEGSLALRVTERSPWVFSHSFGYDRSQGYHIGSGVQRLNVGGMGRSIDFGFRASDATLDSARLREAFPTGAFPRSIDIYSLGYTDPRFSPALLGGWVPDRTQYRIEAAYIVERQNTYEFRRRRVLNTFDWRLDGQRVIQVGHRYERVDVGLQVVAEDPDYFKNSQFPDGRVVISAPFARFVRDTRDNSFDPTRGTFLSVRMEFANQLFGTSRNTSFVKLDARHQWNWPLGQNASRGVAVLGLRLGVANPTASTAERFPLSERFFAGGPFTHRGVEPDALGPRLSVPELDPATGRQKVGPDGNLVYLDVPAGGQALALVNLEYRFPLYATWLWGETFIDSGQVYRTIHPGQRNPDPSNPTYRTPPPYPPFRTAVGVGFILKFGLPIKLEYAIDAKRLFGKRRTREEEQTDLTGILVSAGFQF